MSVLHTYGPIDRALIARNAHIGAAKPSTLRRGTEKTPEYRPFSRDDYSLGRYQRASSARLARRITRAALVACGIIVAAAFGAVLAALSTGALG